MMPIIVIAVLCADIATTWYLLINYGKVVKEVGLLGKALLKMGHQGHFAFAAIRIVLAFLVIQFTGIGGQIAWSAVTLFAVVNNLLVIRRLRNGGIR